MTDLTSDFPENDIQSNPTGFGIGSIFLMACIVLAAVIIGFALMRQHQTQPTTGLAPDFEFTTFDGQSYKLSDFRGKVVFLNFWASWCGPCRDEAPELQTAWEQYQAQGKDVVFIGIAYADNGPRSEAYLEEFGITYLNAPDLGTRISDLYNIQGVPETFVIDQEGNISEFLMIQTTRDMIRDLIDPLLTKGSTPS